MHIKQVVINGFRSFRNQSEIEPFSSGHNVIVGRNGSGKSNFFDAIQFVLLAPRFAHLRPEDRQHLLHEGAGQGVMAAYVEIIFDNSDGRFPVESDEVILRRSVGHKKDEFFLNRKRVQKLEVSSLLESAGFSKSNPYYIVQQGKVSNICLMRDKDRLNLLKEVAGTTVYEERRNESLKIIQETKSKQDQIAEILTFIEERLDELEKEKDELKAYEMLDKHRKALEYNMYDKELSKSGEQLNQIEITREEERVRHQEVYGQFRDLQDQLLVEEEQLVSLRSAMDRLASKRVSKLSELNELKNIKASADLALHDLESSRDVSGHSKAELAAAVDQIKSQMRDLELQLNEIDPQFEELSASKLEVEQQLDESKVRVDELYAKQGRGKQFSTAYERDAFLEEQLGILSSQLQSKEAVLKSLTSDINAETGRVKKDSSQYEKAADENRSKGSQIDDIGHRLHDKTCERNSLQERRKSVWREQEVLNEKFIEVRQESEKAKKSLNAALPKQIVQGLAAVARIAEEMKLKGYYGPLIDNFSLKNDAFRTCVEVAAGTALFNVIVDTDRTAAILIKELERRKCGRITFLPLNRIRNDEVNYPVSNDVRPLMDVALLFDDKFEPAIRQVFGKKLLARDLDVAAHFSKISQLDAITKDGDLVNRRGGFEGGYYDDRESRIATVLRIRSSSAELQGLTQQDLTLKRSSEELEMAINETLRAIQDLERERDVLKRTSEQMSVELLNRKKLLNAAVDSLSLKTTKLSQLKEDIVQAEHQISVYRNEIGTPLQSKLTDLERDELKQLAGTEKSLFVRLDKVEQDLLEVSRRRDGIRADLATNLAKRLGDSERQLQNLALKSDVSFLNEISELRNQIEVSSVSIIKMERELDDLDETMELKKAEFGKLDKLQGERRLNEIEGTKVIDEAAKMQDKLLSKRSLLQESIQQKQRLIRELGTLPRKELEDFRNLSEKQLLKKLKEVNEELKKYASVNRKALDQYVSFNEQRESLIGRSGELDKDSVAITQLLSSLDQQKDEAILRTFQDVRAHFTEVFSELVPEGEGQLVMRTSLDASEEEEVEGEDGSGQGKVSSFQGVQIKVSFTGAGQQYDMQQLSGGQKALVALALIFAIQRSDPAPFYLFDEIDQALDSNYRAGVARLIKRQAESQDAPAQFITTTFRPEQVTVADKCYGISLQHKVSSIIPLDKSDAIKFVIDLLNEEEAVGKVSAVPSFSRQQRQKEAAEEQEDPVSSLNEEPVEEPDDEEAEDEEDDDDEEVQEDEAPTEIRTSKMTRAAKLPTKKSRRA